MMRTRTWARPYLIKAGTPKRNGLRRRLRIGDAGKKDDGEYNRDLLVNSHCVSLVNL
jgi:hypothetical protein